MGTSVTWSEHTKGQARVTKTWDCFASLCGMYSGKEVQPDVVRYAAVVSPTLTIGQATRYAAFLTDLFDNGLLRYRIDTKRHRLVWLLKTKGLNKITTRLYLTAARYVNEYPAIVLDWLKTPATASLDAQFAAFQEAHQKAVRGEISAYNLWGHGLIAGLREPIGVKAFRANVKAVRSDAQSHFNAPANGA